MYVYCGKAVRSTGCVLLYIDTQNTTTTMVYMIWPFKKTMPWECKVLSLSRVNVHSKFTWAAHLIILWINHKYSKRFYLYNRLFFNYISYKQIIWTITIVWKPFHIVNQIGRKFGAIISHHIKTRKSEPFENHRIESNRIESNRTEPKSIEANGKDITICIDS